MEELHVVHVLREVDNVHSDEACGSTGEFREDWRAPPASGVQQHVCRTQVMLHFALENAIGMVTLEVPMLEPLCECCHRDKQTKREIIRARCRVQDT